MDLQDMNVLVGFTRHECLMEYFSWFTRHECVMDLQDICSYGFTRHECVMDLQDMNFSWIYKTWMFDGIF